MYGRFAEKYSFTVGMYIYFFFRKKNYVDALEIIILTEVRMNVIHFIYSFIFSPAVFR